MNLRDLRYLVSLADTRHFGRAAKACHISQPTLSAQIRKLELELGISIFERNNNLNSEGKRGTPICIWGTHGLGKTQIVRDFAKEKGWKFQIIENLHAKFYLMDKTDLISGSLNLTAKGMGLRTITSLS